MSNDNLIKAIDKMSKLSSNKNLNKGYTSTSTGEENCTFDNIFNNSKEIMKEKTFEDAIKIIEEDSYEIENKKIR